MGPRGFEPRTSSLSATRSNQLSYGPGPKTLTKNRVTKKPPAGCWWPRKVPPFTPASLPAGCHALVFQPKAPTLMPSAACASHLRPGLTRRIAPLPTGGRANIFYRPIRHMSLTPTARGWPRPYRPGSALVYTLPRHCQPRQKRSVPPAHRLYTPSNNSCQRPASTLANAN